MRAIGVMPNLEKRDALSLTRDLVRALEERGLAVRVPPGVAAALGRADLGGQPPEWLPAVDFVIVLGGDGTLLGAAKTISPHGRPILGVNLGHLGFLTEIEASELFGALPQFVEGRFVIEERKMLEAQVVREGRPVRRFAALNDAVVTKGPFARLIRLDTFVDETFVAGYPADGLIVSTPTGSTAYSLSAGGPVVNPNLDVLIVTPICPHTFYARSIVVSKDEVIRIRIHAEHRDSMLTLDGQEGYSLKPGDQLVIRSSPEVVRLMRRPGWSFYEVLRRKLAEREMED